MSRITEYDVGFVEGQQSREAELLPLIDKLRAEIGLWKARFRVEIEGKKTQEPVREKDSIPTQTEQSST